jgi:hypothetical protein
LALGNERVVRKKREKINIDERVEATAQGIMARMVPLEIGLSVYPTARSIPLRGATEAVVRNHLGRYTYAELENGQFLEVLPDEFAFFMDHEARKRRA